MEYLALVLFCKDENLYLEEWLTYHFALGVDHVFIVDNNSRLPICETVKDWVDLGLVTVLPWPDTYQGRQCRAYAKIMGEYGRLFQWMGFTDTDEFICPKTGQDLPAFLKGYEQFGGLGIFWACFGSSGHKTKQPSVIRAYTHRAADNWPSNNHIKSIVQPRFTLPVAMPNPHLFKHTLGKCCVDENGLEIKEARRWPRVANKIQLNHYITRSQEECEAKLNRGGGNGEIRRLNYFSDQDRNCTIQDTEILKVVERLK